MGYYTDYELSIGNCSFDKFLNLKNYLIDDIGYDPFLEDCKWYSHESDMIIFSKKHPEQVFILDGIGEEYPDIWRKYFKNGKKQVEKANISFEECKI